MDILVAVTAGIGFAAAHTFGITLPFYRRVCPVCKATGWAKCDQEIHAHEGGKQA